MDAEGLFYLETKLPEGSVESFKGQGEEKDGWQGEQGGEESLGILGRNLHLAEIKEVKDERYGRRSWLKIPADVWCGLCWSTHNSDWSRYNQLKQVGGPMNIAMESKVCLCWGLDPWSNEISG